MRKQRYNVKRDVKTFMYLREAAKHALELAEKMERGCLYQYMTSLVFSAFTFEAAMNCIGDKKISYWEDIEKIKPIQKMKVLYAYLGLKLDLSCRPAQTITKLFDFRNTMAHAKPEMLSEVVTLKRPLSDGYQESIKTKWEKFCTEKEAKRAMVDVWKVVEQLSQAANMPKYFLHILASESLDDIPR